MKAEEALRQSENRQIVADTIRGLITMSREPSTNNSEAEAFRLRFMPRDEKGHLNAAGALAIGPYDDLDTAVTIAAIGYGVGETQWDRDQTYSKQDAQDE